MLEKFHLDWKIFLANQIAKVMPSVYIWNQLEFAFSMCDCKVKVFAGLLVLFVLRLIFEGNNFPVSNNFSSTSMTSIHLWRSVKKREEEKHFKNTKKRKMFVGHQSIRWNIDHSLSGFGTIKPMMNKTQIWKTSLIVSEVRRFFI